MIDNDLNNRFHQSKQTHTHKVAHCNLYLTKLGTDSRKSNHRNIEEKLAADCGASGTCGSPECEQEGL